MLEIQDLHKRYKTGDRALQGVSISIPKGQIVALIGPSGAGKSTLIRCINRLVEPTQGDIVLNGRSLVRLNQGQLRAARRHMGMIFQEHALVERLSVMENLLAGRLGYVGFWAAWFRRFPEKDIRDALNLLTRVGLEQHVNKRADALSGGQRQRVGIARALMQKPELLLVDEPTASLDPKTSRDIMRLIVELVREEGITAIVNSHDVMLSKQFTERIIGLKAGMVVFDGDPERLDHAMLSEIYGAEDWTGAHGHETNARKAAVTKLTCPQS
jgi:phosphonate transport system ATP-binding protein